MLSRKASLEIGINTIVILVIAMVLLGLGIGFIRNIFGKANILPDFIDVGVLENPPTSAEPIKLTPTELEVKSGDSKELKVGIYNKEGTQRTFSLLVTQCTGGDPGSKPKLDSLTADIPAGTSQGYKVIVTAVDDSQADEPRLTPLKYICNLRGQTTDSGSQQVNYDTQFIMTVVS